jgi:hypothetical protein
MNRTRTLPQTITKRPYTYKELMQIYGVSRRTMMNWLKPYKEEIGDKRGRYLTIIQVGIIFGIIGEPPGYLE